MPILDSTASPETLLRPYLDATLRLPFHEHTDLQIKPLFTAFYIQHIISPIPSTTTPSSKVIVTPQPSHLLSESLDSAASNAETIFWHTLGTLESSTEVVGSSDQDSGEPITRKIGTAPGFWPPLNADTDEEVDEE
jgi:hypothetical protein